MKIFKAIFLMVLGTGRLFSQESGEGKQTKESRLDFTANIQNNHLWRGLIITDKPVVMGNLSYALDAEKKWKVGIWELLLLPMTRTTPTIKRSIIISSILTDVFISDYGIFTIQGISILQWRLMTFSATLKEEQPISLI